MEVEEVIAFFFHFEDAGGLGGFSRRLRLSLASLFLCASELSY